MSARGTRTRAALRRARGFTMVELLIAGFLSAVVLLAIWFVFITNSRQYYRQEQIVQMQESMRFALEYLKTDLRNAGRMAVVNGVDPGPRRDPGLCRNVNARGVQLFDDQVAGAVPNVISQEPNLVYPDGLRLLVDGSGSVPVTTRRLMGSNLLLGTAPEQVSASARAMYSSEARFTATWTAGSYVYVQSLTSDQADLIPITDVAFAAGTPRVTLARASCLPADLCDAGGCLANPVDLVEYQIAEDAVDRLKTDLERRILDVRNGNVRTRQVLAEYIVDMQVYGTYDARQGAARPTIPAEASLKDDLGNWPLNNAEAGRMNDWPERLRALNVVLAARTPREDEDFLAAIGRNVPAAQRVPTDRIWFDVDADGATGYARVTTLLATVETPNLNTGL